MSQILQVCQWYDTELRAATLNIEFCVYAVWGGPSCVHHHHQLIWHGAEYGWQREALPYLWEAAPRRPSQACSLRRLWPGQGCCRLLSSESNDPFYCALQVSCPVERVNRQWLSICCTTSIKNNWIKLKNEVGMAGSKSTQTRDNRIYYTFLRLLFSTISYNAPINVDTFVECGMWEIFRLFPSCHKGLSLSVLIQSYIYYWLFLR